MAVAKYLKPQEGTRLPDTLLFFAYLTNKHFDEPNDGKKFLQCRRVLSRYTILDDNPKNAESSPNMDNSSLPRNGCS
jgi:hypothetical protein